MNEIILKKNVIISDIENRLKNSLTYAKGLAINDQKTAKQASDSLGLLKDMGKKLDDQRKVIVKPYQDKIKDFKAEIDAIIAISDESYNIIRGKYTKYVQEEEKRKREEAEKERQRIIEEEKAKAEEIAKEIRAKADELGMESLKEQAEMVEQSAEQKIAEIEKTTIEVEVVKTKGDMYSTNFRDNWVAEIDDMKEFLSWVVKTERFELIDINKKNLKAIATNMKKEMTVNGIKISNQKILVTR